MPRSFAPRVLLALTLCLPALPLSAQGEAGELAQNLIRLRGEVEQLNDELELQRQEQRTALAGLSARQAELQASVERQELAARELREGLARQREQATQAGVAGAELVPLLQQAIAGLEAYVGSGLPFKREERLGAVAELRTALANGSVPPQRAVNRLWALYEDEFRLTRDNSLHSQTIVLGEERVLADVAKLGTVALYFRTSDGRSGQAVRGAEGWRFVAFEDGEQAEQVAALFDALGKQIRQGYFLLPLVSAGAVR